MTQLTAHNINKLTTFELFKHHAALSSSLDLVTLESKEMLLAEIEACARLRSSKLDGLHYHLTKHEALVNVGKEEKKLLDAQIKHHQAEINSIKGMLMEIRRRGYADGNKITGDRYLYHVIPNPKPEIEISSDLNDWEPDELDRFAMVEEVTTTTQIRSANGKHIIRTDEKVKTRQIPNPDSIYAAHENNEQLPHGVKVVQKYRISTKRILKQANDSEE